MKITDLKIGHRLNISFALTIGMLAVVVAVGTSRLSVVSKEIDATINERYQAISKLHLVKDKTTEQARNLRDALILTDAVHVKEALERAAGPVPSDAEGAAFAAVRDKLVRMARAGQKEEAAAALAAELRPAQQAYEAALDKQIASQVERMRESGEGARGIANMASSIMMALGVVGAVLSMFTAWFITRGIVNPVTQAVETARNVAAGDLSNHIEVESKDEIGQLSQALKDMNDSLVKIVSDVRGGTDTIARASSEIAHGNQDLSTRTEQQANSLRETASSMESLTSTVRQNASNANKANELAASASEVAAKGGDVVHKVVTTMEQINASSRKIVDIISVIDGIAFQTNILALNAAVEAARAGEQGRGFAVVAGEVRNLAQRSAAAAKEISSLINDSVGRVDEGARLADQAGRTMADIVASVQRVTDIMGDITSASQEQLSGIEHVNEAIAVMDQVTQQNAALVEEAAAAAAAMQQEAHQLSSTVDVFKLDSVAQRRAAVIPLPKTAPRTMQLAATQRRAKRANGAEDWESF